MLQRLLIFVMAIMMTVGCATSKKATSEGTVSTESEPAKAMVEEVTSEKASMEGMASAAIGEWEYVISNLPDGDVKGTFTITNEANSFKGTIQSEVGDTPLKGIVMEKNVLKSSSFIAQGYDIEMSGTFEGDAFKGSISAEGYEFPMTAVRKK